MTNINRITEVLQRHGKRFIDRCFSTAEREKVETAANGDLQARAAGYAKRWAAKEACAKALGLGVSNNIHLKDIVVINQADGQPELVLTGGAKDRLTAITPQGMTPQIHVSLTDDPPMAMAFVVISSQ